MLTIFSRNATGQLLGMRNSFYLAVKSDANNLIGLEQRSFDAFHLNSFSTSICVSILTLWQLVQAKSPAIPAVIDFANGLQKGKRTEKKKNKMTIAKDMPMFIEAVKYLPAISLCASLIT